MTKQIQFHDLENNVSHIGIELDNGDIICACCGGLFEGAEEGTTWTKDKIFETWIDFSKYVLTQQRWFSNPLDI